MSGSGAAGGAPATTTTPEPSLRAPWILRYLAELTLPRLVLWCYLIWYIFVLARYFDPSVRLWLSSLGISGIIGTGLYLSTAHGGRTRTRLETWQVVRLYMMPFCVSSFAALVKGRGFILVFSPSLREDLLAFGCCAIFCGFVALVKCLAERRGQGSGDSP